MKTEHTGKTEAAKETGVSAAAAAAASGALKGAAEASSTALMKICKALITKTIHGVKVLAKEPELACFSNN